MSALTCPFYGHQMCVCPRPPSFIAPWLSAPYRHSRSTR